MKKRITSLLIVSVTITAMSFTILSDDGRAGVTGSPNESTCNQSTCHNSFTINTGGGSVVITAPTLNNWSYALGQTYAITVTVSKPNVTLFGLGFEALTSAGANAGTLTAGTGTTTLNATIAGNSRKSIVHTKNGGTGTTGSHSFTFNWTAPTTDVGSITFYCAGNAANADKGVSGDYIYTTSQLVKSPSTSVGIIEQHEFAKQLNVYPNPAVNQLQIRNESNPSSKMNVTIMDLKGALISQQQNITSSEMVELENMNTGVYLLKIESEGRVAFKQFVKQ